MQKVQGNLRAKEKALSKIDSLMNENKSYLEIIDKSKARVYEGSIQLHKK